MDIKKVVIAGSRDWLVDHIDIQHALVLLGVPLHKELEIVCGEARGADASGRKYAEKYWHNVKSFPADWETHGKAAGFIRNTEMADYADAAIVFILNNSKGSQHMVEQMRKRNKPVVVFYRYSEE